MRRCPSLTPTFHLPAADHAQLLSGVLDSVEKILLDDKSILVFERIYAYVTVSLDIPPRALKAFMPKKSGGSTP